MDAEFSNSGNVEDAESSNSDYVNSNSESSNSYYVRCSLIIRYREFNSVRNCRGSDTVQEITVVEKEYCEKR